MFLLCINSEIFCFLSDFEDDRGLDIVRYYRIVPRFGGPSERVAYPAVQTTFWRGGLSEVEVVSTRTETPPSDLFGNHAANVTASTTFFSFFPPACCVLVDSFHFIFVSLCFGRAFLVCAVRCLARST